MRYVFVLALLAQAAFLETRAEGLVAIPLGLDLYMPTPEDNPLHAETIALGRTLFHDKRLSRDESLSCASCHDPDRAFAGDEPKSVGVFGRKGPRNVPAILNRVYGRSFFWDGRITTLEEEVLEPIQNPLEMDLTLAEAEARIGLSATEISHALASYIRSILSGDSAFDRFMSGDREALTEFETEGLAIFRGKGNCDACHRGPNFTDEELHNTGVAFFDGDPADWGGGRGNFKTPTLREIARTPPYMHDGSFATLEDVVDFYSGGGGRNPELDRNIRPLELTATEKSALIAFLQALTGIVFEGIAG